MIFAVAFMVPLSVPIAISSYMQYKERKRMEEGTQEKPIKMVRKETGQVYNASSAGIIAKGIARISTKDISIPIKTPSTVMINSRPSGAEIIEHGLSPKTSLMNVNNCDFSNELSTVD